MDILTALQTMLEFYTDPLLQVQALLKIIGEYGYSEELRQITNSQTTYSTVRFYSLVLIGQCVGNITFISSTDSKMIVTQLNNIFEAEYEYQTDMEIFDYLSELQAQTCSYVLSQGFGLPQLIEYSPKTTLPACVIAQNLYQDGSRSDEIIQRNNSNVRHPLFMPLTLEVLSS